MSNENSSDLARLFFWFIWLCGFVLAAFLLVRFFYFSLLSEQHQLAIPFFLSFLWQGIVQITALKRYQLAEGVGGALLTELVGTLLLVVMVGAIVAFRT